MRIFNIPKRKDVSVRNQKYFDYFNDHLGMIPNLYASLAYSENALSSFYSFQARKSSLSRSEQEAISLIVAQENNSLYGINTYTMRAKLNGFSEEEVGQLRQGIAPFNEKLDAFVRLIKNVIEKTGEVDEIIIKHFLDSGYTMENFIDALLAIGENLVSSFISVVLNIPVDFPSEAR